MIWLITGKMDMINKNHYPDLFEGHINCLLYLILHDVFFWIWKADKSYIDISPEKVDSGISASEKNGVCIIVWHNQ